jgi:hypothetical protein
MMDIRQLATKLTRAIHGDDFPDAGNIARTLDLDISKARITRTETRFIGIQNAHLNDGKIDVDLVCGAKPQAEIWLLFKDSCIAYRNLRAEIFGANQRILPSKYSAGFGVLFEIDGLTCGFTVSSPSGMIDSVSLNHDGIEIGIACGITPWREIWLVFLNPSLAYPSLKTRAFGANQRVQPSKLSAGLAVLCEINGSNCGLTVSSFEGFLQTLFCEERKSTWGDRG